MNNTQKIMGMLQLLEMNDDLFRYEMTSLGTKINNFFEDRSRLLSGQWLNVMYVSLAGENANESVEMHVNEAVATHFNESFVIDGDDDVLVDACRIVDNSPFALVH